LLSIPLLACAILKNFTILVGFLGSGCILLNFTRESEKKKKQPNMQNEKIVNNEAKRKTDGQLENLWLNFARNPILGKAL